MASAASAPGSAPLPGAVLAANVYVSEGRDAELLALLEAAAGRPLVHVFSDAAYNRTGFTLASRDSQRVRFPFREVSALSRRLRSSTTQSSASLAPRWSGCVLRRVWLRCG